jgi:hypothetical protein
VRRKEEREIGKAKEEYKEGRKVVKKLIKFLMKG